MARKKRQIVMYNSKWESDNLRGGRFYKICHDMVNSKAWKELSLRQRGLYFQLKTQYFQRSDGSSTENDIVFCRTDKLNYYGSIKTADNDIDKLIELGFIKVFYHGKFIRKPTKYAFTDEWKKYGDTDFKIHPSSKRLTNKNK